MRAAFLSALQRMMDEDKRLVLLLGDVGAFSARKIFAEFPDRAFNLGIREQAIIDIAAGMSKAGLVPVIYGIAPFFVERALEQIKIAAYNGCKIVLVSVGASYDYSAEGPTHQCPGDLAILRNVPGMMILVPGTVQEMRRLLAQSLDTSDPVYMRLSETINPQNTMVELGRGTIVRQGGPMSTVAVALGPMLADVMTRLGPTDTTILYYTALEPFDADLIARLGRGKRVLVYEDNYPALFYACAEALLSTDVESVAIPRRFIEGYGTRAQIKHKLYEKQKGIGWIYRRN